MGRFRLCSNNNNNNKTSYCQFALFTTTTATVGRSSSTQFFVSRSSVRTSRRVKTFGGVKTFEPSQNICDESNQYQHQLGPLLCLSLAVFLRRSTESSSADVVTIGHSFAVIVGLLFSRAQDERTLWRKKAWFSGAPVTSAAVG